MLKMNCSNLFFDNQANDLSVCKDRQCSMGKTTVCVSGDDVKSKSSILLETSNCSKRTCDIILTHDMPSTQSDWKNHFELGFYSKQCRSVVKRCDPHVRWPKEKTRLEEMLASSLASR